MRTVRTRLINDVTIDTTHVQESIIKVIKLILLVHKKNLDVESSEESLKQIDDSSEISDEEKELCSTLLSLQPATITFKNLEFKFNKYTRPRNPVSFFISSYLWLPRPSEQTGINLVEA